MSRLRVVPEWHIYDDLIRLGKIRYNGDLLDFCPEPDQHLDLQDLAEIAVMLKEATTSTNYYKDQSHD